MGGKCWATDCRCSSELSCLCRRGARLGAAISVEHEVVFSTSLCPAFEFLCSILCSSGPFLPPEKGNSPRSAGFAQKEKIAASGTPRSSALCLLVRDERYGTREAIEEAIEFTWLRAHHRGLGDSSQSWPVPTRLRACARARRDARCVRGRGRAQAAAAAQGGHERRALQRLRQVAPPATRPAAVFKHARTCVQTQAHTKRRKNILGARGGRWSQLLAPADVNFAPSPG